MVSIVSVARTAGFDWVHTLKVLILGGTGMLGHQLCMTLSNHNVTATVRKLSVATTILSDVFDSKFIETSDILSPVELQRIFKVVRPEVVINAIAAVKQHGSTISDFMYYKVNSVFPWQVATLCAELGIRFVHISTDGVFDGAIGNYSEASVPTANDVYGLSKAIGEVVADDVLTLRTSIIGFEIADQRLGLLEWFVGETNRVVSGYNHAWFSGVTTETLSSEIDYLLANPNMRGIYNIGSHSISKYSLLNMIRTHLGIGNYVEPCELVKIDRTLDSTKYWLETKRPKPLWEQMISSLRDDYLRRMQIGLR